MKIITSFVGRLPEWLVFLVVLVMPLLWLPWTPEALEFNKQALLLCVAVLALAAWLFRGLRKESLTLSLAPNILSSCVVAIVVFLSFLFSQDKYRSLIGFGNGSVDSFATIGAAILLGFLAATSFSENSSRRRLLWVFALSGTLAGIIAILGAFGWLKTFFTTAGFPVESTSGFNTIGSLSSLTVFLDLTLLVSVALAATARKITGKILASLFSIALLAILVVVSMPFGWWLLAFGSLVLFVFLLIQSPAQAVSTNLIRPPLIFAFAVAIAIIKPNLFGGLVNLPLEISPSQSTTIVIAQKTLLEDNRFLLGSGPGTWVFDYAKHRPQNINATAFWSLRFLQGSAKIPSMASTHGALGILAWLLVAVTLLGSIAKQALGVYRVRKNTLGVEPIESDFPAIGALSVAFLASQFLTTTNTTLETFFWLTAGMVAARQSFFVITIPKSSAKAAISSLFAVFALVGFLVVGYFVGIRYVGALAYVNGLQKTTTNDLTGSLSRFQRARTFDSQNDLYARTLSQAALLRLASFQNGNQAQRAPTQEEINALVTVAIGEARRATTVSPQFVENWSQLANVQTNFIALGNAANVAKVLDPAISAWQQAINLEPLSPFLYLQRGVAYLTAADKVAERGEDGATERASYLEAARTDLEKSRDLKNDYAPALFQLAMLDVREGKTTQAIARLEDAKRLVPQDIGLLFQLGVLYYNAEGLDNAKNVLGQALKVQLDQGQEYVNARYFLGLIADKQGNHDEAVAQFEAIKKVNQDNTLIDQILKNLESGKHALDGISSQGPGVPPPPTEKPRTEPREPGL